MLKHCVLADGRVIPGQDQDCPIQVYVAPDEAEKRLLIDKYKLDEHTLNSALDPDEQARIEFEPDHVALIVKRPKNYSGRDKLVFKVLSVGMFRFADKLIVVQSLDLPLFDGKQFSRVGSLNEVMLRVIYSSTVQFLEHLRVINQLSDELEKKINASMENKYLINLFGLEKSLVYYVTSTASNVALVERLKLNTERLGFRTEEKELLDDLSIETGQCRQQAEMYSSVLAGLMDARVSIVSNNLNVLMKTLNLITIGIMVPTLVVSIFSMNVGLPLEQHPQAFWFVIGLAAVSVFAVIMVWRRKKW
jgi:magnesium transporter